jgi:hypothetical protein
MRTSMIVNLLIHLRAMAVDGNGNLTLAMV